MKNETEKINALIEKALSAEEAEFYHNLDEQSMPEMVSGLFRGKLKWITLISMVAMLVIFALGVYCLIKFLTVEEIRGMIKWGAAMMFCMLGVSMLKLMYWIQMDKNALMREIKRLEWQISLLAGKISSSGK